MLMIQFTGLSGAGKTTIANLVKKKLDYAAIPTEVIDGDYYRNTICSDLGFSEQDRHENIRRLGKIANELVGKSIIAILATINPYEAIRRELVEQYQAKTIYIQCGLNTLIQRDTKGLYARGLLPNGHPDKLCNLSGINDPYEIPESPNLILNTQVEGVDECVEKLYAFILLSCRTS